MSLFWSSSEGGVSGTFSVLGGVIVFSVEEEGVSGRKFTIESSESESMTIMSDDKLNLLLGSVFILDVSMGSFVFLKCVKCHWDGWEGWRPHPY